MNVSVEVDLATARPPAAHARVWARVAVEVPEHAETIAGLDGALARAEAEAREVACALAMATRPGVVMPVAARVVEVDSI